MKVKTSITLAPETLQALDELGGESTRSRVIETAVLEYIERRRRQERDSRDLEVLNRSAKSLNEELDDILGYQIEPRSGGEEGQSHTFAARVIRSGLTPPGAA